MSIRFQVSSEGFELGEDVLQDWNVGWQASGALGMRIVARDPASEFEELGGGVFISGDRVPKCEEAEILQNVIKFVKTRVTFEPVFISQGEVFGGKGGDAE